MPKNFRDSDHRALYRLQGLSGLGFRGGWGSVGLGIETSDHSMAHHETKTRTARSYGKRHKDVTHSVPGHETSIQTVISARFITPLSLKADRERPHVRYAKKEKPLSNLASAMRSSVQVCAVHQHPGAHAVTILRVNGVTPYWCRASAPNRERSACHMNPGKTRRRAHEAASGALQKSSFS